MSERVQAQTLVAPVSPANGTRAVRPSITPVRSAMLQRACACGQLPGTGGKCDECDKKEKGKVLQRASTGGPQPATIPPILNNVLNSPGRPLDTSTRSFMESRFDHDFGAVRIHNDSLAAESARAVNAKAYTVGQDVVFADGRYAPGTTSGDALLAHELAHTIQQSGIQYAKESASFSYGSEYAALEHEADHAASAALSGRAIRLAPVAAPVLSRKKGDDPDEEGKRIPAKSKKPASKRSSLGVHKVTPTEAFESSEGRIQEFEVDPFYMPAAKGPAAKTEYENIAGQKLETLLEITGKGKTKTALWQKREVTEELRSRWLSKVGWSAESADDLWKRAGGSAEFPKVKPDKKTEAKTCQMDHIVELQLGGDNTDQNIQPLEAGPNQSSGGAIKGELQTLALAIAEDSTLATDDMEEIKLRFKSVEVEGKLETLPSGCPPAKPTCLGVEKCAQGLKVEKTATGEVKISTVDYPISVGGGSSRQLKVPVTFAQAKDEEVKIEGHPENNAASTIIPGLLLTKLRHEGKGKKAQDVIDGRIDNRPETRLPISLEGRTDPIKLLVADDGVLTLDPALKKKAAFGFTYKYLSPGQITRLEINSSGGVDWYGSLAPTIPFLRKLDIFYKQGELAVGKSLDPKDLKPPFPGVRVSEASLALKLAPEFKPEGKLGFLFGPEGKPLAEAIFTASTDGTGFIAEGKLRVFIPGVDKAEADVTYKGGGEYGAGTWTGTITIESSQIKLPYVESGSVVVTLVAHKGVDVEGKLNLKLPGENTATVGVKRTEQAWLLTGGGRFHVPKVGPVTVIVIYNTATKKLIAEGKDIKFEIFGLTAHLDSITGELEPGHHPVFYGSGGVELKKGKVDGRADLKLNKDGKFTGKGSIQYKFNENFTATAGVELDDKERLKFSGELVITKIKLFDAFGDTKELFSLDIPIPIPGASIGGVGLEARIGGGVTVGYTIGPGTVAPLKFEAAFYPLEEQSDLSLGVSGSLNIPAEAFLEANVHADIVLDVFIAEVGGGIKLTGTIKLKGGLFVPFSATYKQGKIEGEMTPELKFALLLGIALSIHAWAKAGVGWLSVKTEKEWTLARREIDTGLGFSISAPIKYSTETGPKLPSIDQVVFKPPEVSKEKLKSILNQLVSGADEKEV